MKPGFYFNITLLILTLTTNTVSAGEWSGNFSFQSRNFLSDSAVYINSQHNQYLSLAAEPEYYHRWDNEKQSFTFTPFYRLDQHDDERTHGDIREMSWHKIFDNWELKLGISKVFWGVTESQHLVDIINQTDQVENIDGEDKLGQPMIKASIERDWGLIDFFILPGFRERTLTGSEGRPRSVAIPLTNNTLYESEDKDRHIDYAVRWFNTIGDWDIGLSYFQGTSREPVFLPTLIPIFPPEVIPYYPLIKQTGLELQSTTEDWLWKLELIHRKWMDDSFVATTAGFEYTFYGVFETDADIGIISEYLYDDRTQYITSIFDNDIMLGMRLAINDAQSSEVLMGFIIDRDTHETLVNIEASKRIGNNWKAELEARLFNNIKPGSLINDYKTDDFIQLNIAYYF
ncbi:MAG: hypothetical protein OEZ38_03245 [Gammaproteobacteria bacterium]|nr:hypothetical protein [Gammaproteobacteria bacterium]